MNRFAGVKDASYYTHFLFENPHGWNAKFGATNVVHEQEL